MTGMSKPHGFSIVGVPHDWIAKDYLNGETADPLRINPAEPLETLSQARTQV